MKKYGLIALAVIVLDQITKAYVREFPLGETFFEMPGLLSLTHCVNSGAAFSMLSGHPALLAFLSLALLALIWTYAVKKLRLSVAGWAAFACLVGGGVGNLLDRLLFSGVTDYIRLRFIDFPVFNLADIAITGSIAVLLILLFTDTLEEPLEDKHGSDG
ncbi:MAG: signal peptidase II [Clostridia bacterium]|nr:signal peptidase II [Clostridia bacterium]